MARSSFGDFGNPDIRDFLNFDAPQSPPSSPGAASGLGELVLLGANGELSPVESRSGGGGFGGTTFFHRGTTPPPTLVGPANGLQFNLIWDASVASAPAGFMTAAITAATFYTSMFSNHEVINVHVGYGEVGGLTLPSGALAASESYGYMENYSTVVGALKLDGSSANASLPASDPTAGGSFFVSTAEAKALGQVSGSGTGIDGYIGLSSHYSFSYNQSSIGSGQFDAVGAFEHELSEVMGRVGSLGSLFGPNIYTPLDLFRYSAPGVRDLTPGPGYFSINGGNTNLGAYNNPNNGGDASDWIPTLVGDSYGDGYPGVPSRVSATDLIEDSVLGYRLTPLGVASTKTPGLA